MEDQNEPVKAKKPRSCLGCFLKLLSIVVVLKLLLAAGIWIYVLRTKHSAEDLVAELDAAQEPTSFAATEDFRARLVGDRPDVTESWLPILDVISKPTDSEIKFDNNPYVAPVGFEAGETGAIEYLAHFADLFSDIHATADKRGVGSFVEYSGFILHADLDDVQNLRSVVQGLALEATLQARQGNAEEFVRSILRIHNTADLLEFEPHLITQLMRIALHQAAVEQVRASLTHLELSEPQAKALRDRLESTEFLMQCNICLRGERAGMMEGFIQPSVILSDASSGADKLNYLPTRFDDLRYFCETIDGLILATSQPWPDAFIESKQREDEFDTALDESSKLQKLRYLMTYSLFPATQAVVVAAARSRFSCDAASLGLAIDQFVRKNDRLPENLDELVPDYCARIPKDPFDGQPIRYRAVEGRQYILYSVGPNQTDDGGMMADRRGNPDLVFRVPFPREDLSER